MLMYLYKYFKQKFYDKTKSKSILVSNIFVYCFAPQTLFMLSF